MTENERAIKSLKELRDDCYEDDGYGNMTDECSEELWAIDTAIDALKEHKATWSEVIATNVEHDGVIRHFCCSYCGRVVSVLYPQELELLYPYCHCGAKMEVDE